MKINWLQFHLSPLCFMVNPHGHMLQVNFATWPNSTLFVGRPFNCCWNWFLWFVIYIAVDSRFGEIFCPIFYLLLVQCPTHLNCLVLASLQTHARGHNKSRHFSFASRSQTSPVCFMHKGDDVTLRWLLGPAELSGDDLLLSAARKRNKTGLNVLWNYLW